MVVTSDIEPVRRDRSVLQQAYRKRLKGLIKRYRHGKSIRSIAKQMRISHPTLLMIFNKPNRPVSPKVMKKIIRRTTAKKRKPRTDAGKSIRGWPVGDAI